VHIVLIKNITNNIFLITFITINFKWFWKINGGIIIL
jgi:hypothetical protein